MVLRWTALPFDMPRDGCYVPGQFTDLAGFARTPECRGSPECNSRDDARRLTNPQTLRIVCTNRTAEAPRGGCELLFRPFRCSACWRSVSCRPRSRWSRRQRRRVARLRRSGTRSIPAGDAARCTCARRGSRRTTTFATRTGRSLPTRLRARSAGQSGPWIGASSATKCAASIHRPHHLRHRRLHLRHQRPHHLRLRRPRLRRRLPRGRRSRRASTPLSRARTCSSCPRGLRCPWS